MIGALLWAAGAGCTELFRHAVVFAHGAEEQSPFGADSAALTDTALKKMYLLGREVGRRHVGFFPKAYAPTFQATRASNSDAALLSAQAFLGGLYPRESGLQVTDNAEYHAPPLEDAPKPLLSHRALPQGLALPPIVVAGDGLDVAFCKDCPGLQAQQLAAFNKAIPAEFNATFAPLFAQLAAPGEPPSLLGLAAACYVRTAQGDAPPALQRQCELLHVFLAFAAHADRKIARSLRHPLAKQLHDFLGGKPEGQRSLAVAGHAASVASLLSAFLPRNHRCVAQLYTKEFGPAGKPARTEKAEECVTALPPGSSLAFEVSSAEPREVRAVLNGASLRLFQGKDTVPLRDFLRGLRNGFDPQFRAHCANSQLISSLRVKKRYKLAFVLTFAAVLVLAMLAFLADLKPKAPPEDQSTQPVEIPVPIPAEAPTPAPAPAPAPVSAAAPAPGKTPVRSLTQRPAWPSPTAPLRSMTRKPTGAAYNPQETPKAAALAMTLLKAQSPLSAAQKTFNF